MCFVWQLIRDGGAKGLVAIAATVLSAAHALCACVCSYHAAHIVAMAGGLTVLWCIAVGECGAHLLAEAATAIAAIAEVRSADERAERIAETALTFDPEGLGDGTACGAALVEDRTAWGRTGVEISARATARSAACVRS